MSKTKTFVIAGVALLASSAAAWAAGIFPGFPAASIAGLTLPLTGNETIPADTNLPSGAVPQTELLTPENLYSYGQNTAGAAGFRNLLIGGDFFTNLWQRGTSFTGIASTATYTADRFQGFGGGSSSISISKQTGATDIPKGYGASLRMQRADSNSNTAAVCFGQVITQDKTLRTQGQTIVVSLHDYAPSTFSAAGDTVSITVATGTTANEAASGFWAGTWTGYASAGTQTIEVTKNWKRDYVSFTIPAAAVEEGVKFCFTPVGTATSDYWEAEAIQLEVNPQAVPGGFERLQAELEAQREYPYYQQFNEVIGRQFATGEASTTTVALMNLPLIAPMRAIPTTTVTTGTFLASKSDGTAASSCTATATATSNTLRTAGITVTCGADSFTAGNASLLLGGAGATGILALSSEL